MKKRVLAILLASMLMLAAAGCQNKEDGSSAAESSGGDAQIDETAEAGDEMPVEETAPAVIEPFEKHEITSTEPVAAYQDYKVEPVVYGYFYYAFLNDMQNQALSSGYGSDQMEEFWQIEQDGILLKDLLQRETLRQAKEYAVLYQQAVANGTKADTDLDKETETQIDAMLETLDGDQQAFLNQYGLTPDQLKGVYKQMNLLDQYTAQVYESVEVSEEEIKASFEENKDQYEQVTVRHVLVNSDDSMSDEAKAQAKEKAEDILKQVQEGADIGELAAEMSDDVASRETKGEYTFGRGMMVPEFEEWAFGATAGQQGMVQSVYGYHIMQLMSKQDADYDSMKEQIESDLKMQKATEALGDVESIVNSSDWELDQGAIDAFTVTGA